MQDKRITKVTKGGHNFRLFVPTEWSDDMKIPDKGVRATLTRTGKRKMEVEFP